MNTVKSIALLGIVGGFALSISSHAQGITAKTVVDRAQIEDLITRYYNNFGRKDGQSFGIFYADDAEMLLGTNSFKGREAIEGMYKSAGMAATPQRKAFAFNIILSNVQVIVEGNTARARALFTETIIENKGDAPRILTQGREFDTFVKVGDSWKFKKRQIVGPETIPADWKD